MSETTATSGTSAGSVEAGPADDSVPAGAAHQPDQPAASGAAAAAEGAVAESPAPVPAAAEPAGSEPAVEPAVEHAAGGAGEPTEPVEAAGPSGPPDLPQPEPPDPAPPGTVSPPPPPSAPPPPADPGEPAAPRPSFTRPPGMEPPPQTIDAATQPDRRDPATTVPAAIGVPSSPVLSGPPRPDASSTSASGSFPVVSASAPVSAPPRATGRATTGGTTVHPIGTSAGTAVGAARVGERTRPSRNTTTTPRGPRRARLGIKRIDPWSVMKFSFAVSLVLFIVMIVAASVLYLALDSMGVFASINETIAELVESGGGEGQTFRITAQGVIGTAGVLGALNVLLFTSLATLAAFIYNVCADLVGGVEVTLAERE